MTAHEYRETLSRLGLSINGAGPALGISHRQSFRYASGENAIPQRVVIMLGLMLGRVEQITEPEPCIFPATFSQLLEQAVTQGRTLAAARLAAKGAARVRAKAPSGARGRR